MRNPGSVDPHAFALATDLACRVAEEIDPPLFHVARLDSRVRGAAGEAPLHGFLDR
jgi:hypothetical protein